MKKIVTLVCTIATAFVFGQNTSTISTTQEAPNWPILLSNLNTTQISSGVLLDKVTDFANITNFNTTDKNISSREHFTQTMSELFTASDQSRFISVTALKDKMAYNTEDNSVDVGIINTSFERLNLNEDSPTLSGLTLLNNQYSAVAGKPSFVSKKVLIAAPLKDGVRGASINFNFNDEFVFTNATTAIKNITVRFEENPTNAPVTILNNGAFVLSTKNIVYSTSGTKVLEFVITFSDNTVITTFARIDVIVDNGGTLRGVNPSLCNENLRDRGVFTSTLPFKGYGTNELSFNGRIEYTVFYSDTNTAKKMLKPIILVDGFDPGDTRKVKDCDCEQDDTCRNLDKYNDETFSWVSFPHIVKTFNPVKHVSIYDSTEYIGLSTTTGAEGRVIFIDELRTLGYDVIIINNPSYSFVDPNQPTVQVWVPTRYFPFVPGHYETRTNTIQVDGGADYIERNALTLVSFIQNYVKPLQNSAGSTDKLVLIGPSMGGQITRYALAYMEKKFAETNLPVWKHNARLWVSVDSPHLGANIPVGAQANIYFLASILGKEPAQKSYNDLNSAAGQQQSILNFDNSLNSPSHSLTNSGGFLKYYNDLATNGVAGSNGFPVSIPGTFRKIALTNGSLTGAKQGTESQISLNTKVFIRGIWPFQSSTITLARFQDRFLPGYGVTDFVFFGNRLSNRYSASVANLSIRGSLDIVPGGYFKVAKLLKDAIEEGASKDGYRSETAEYVENNSFISTFSALAHLQPNQNWSNPLNRNLTCPSNRETPFDSYFGKSTNTEHTSFSKESADWLKKELAGQPQAPYFPLEANLLTGDNVICENQIKTYQFNDICKIPGKATFTVVGNLTIISSTDYSVTIKGGLDGQAKIIADFGNGLKYEKNIRVGAPSISSFAIQGGNNTVPYGNVSTFTVTPSPNIISPENYQWSIIPISSSCLTLGELYLPGATPPLFLSGNGNTSITVNWGTCAGTYILRCAITNECMRPVWYSDKVIKVFNQATNNPCASKIVLTPNPLKNSDALVLNIAQPVPTAPCQSGRISSKTEIYSVEIYNLQSIKVYSGKINPNTNELTNFNLVRGIYVVHATASDGEIYKEKLIVE